MRVEAEHSSNERRTLGLFGTADRYERCCSFAPSRRSAPRSPRCSSPAVASAAGPLPESGRTSRAARRLPSPPPGRRASPRSARGTPRPGRRRPRRGDPRHSLPSARARRDRPPRRSAGEHARRPAGRGRGHPPERVRRRRLGRDGRQHAGARSTQSPRHAGRRTARAPGAGDGAVSTPRPTRADGRGHTICPPFLEFIDRVPRWMLAGVAALGLSRSRSGRHGCATGGGSSGMRSSTRSRDRQRAGLRGLLAASSSARGATSARSR